MFRRQPWTDPLVMRWTLVLQRPGLGRHGLKPGGKLGNPSVEKVQPAVLSQYDLVQVMHRPLQVGEQALQFG